MGSQTTKTEMQTQLSQANSEMQDYYHEYFQIKECCGYKYQQNIKSMLIWENNFIRNCSDLKNIYKWAELMINFIKQKKISRLKYIREFNDLKFQQESSYVANRNSILSRKEAKQFKDNLKKSVLISFSDAKNQQIQKNAQVLQSVIINPSHNYIRKKNQYLQQFNRSTIVKDNRITSRISVGASIKSFIDDTLVMLRQQQEQISKDKALQLQIFMKFTILMEKHLNDKDNKLHYLIQIFCETIYQKYPVSKSLTDSQINQLANQIKIFLVLLRHGVQDYYNTHQFYDLQQKCNHLITNSENILSTVTAILFKNTKFYEHIFQIFKRLNSHNQQKFKEVVQNLNKKGPQFFQIDSSYCLNQITINHYINGMSVQSNIQNLQPEQLQSNSEQPYYECIQILKRLQKSRTPISKMKIIMQCSEKITESIAEFYQNNGLMVKQKVLDADQVLSIFCYIIAKSNIKDIHSHLLILENFATQQQLISAAGYYYSVITGALQQVQCVYSNN